MGWPGQRADRAGARSDPGRRRLRRTTILPPIAARYWHTLRHLRPAQFTARARFRLARPKHEPGPAPALRERAGVWTAPAARAPSMVGPGQFTLLNESATLAEAGWDDPSRAKLWRYNQHYFDDCNAAGAASRGAWHIDLIAAWLAANPPATGTGWEPYPVSLRIVNWTKWLFAGHPPPPGMLDSLAVQARWLMRRLEWHLLGNHLFANAKALLYASRLFAGAEARRWAAAAAAIIDRELPEQILADGGQFELSPMYHALALEDVLDLVNLLRAFPPAPGEGGDALARRLESLVPAMGRWLDALCHGDGEIGFFNDAAFGIAPAPGELAAYAERLGLSWSQPAGACLWLRDSGYARLSSGEALLLTDLARIGPDYLPGHAHADTLSFEFSLGLQRVLVNSGTSLYGAGPVRQRQRGSAAHNCVVVDGRNSSDVWSGFRVGRRARPVHASVSHEGDRLVAEGAHDGYCTLPGKPLVHRRWTLEPGLLSIEDRVTSPELAAEARYHFHPALGVTLVTPGAGAIRLPGRRELVWRAEGRAVRLEPSTWHPQFGQSHPNTCLVLALDRGRARFEIEWR